MPGFKNIKGQTFNELTVMERIEDGPRRRVLWRCQCSCGGETTAECGQLTSNHKKSCGCLRSAASRATGRKNAHAPGVAAFRGLVKAYRWNAGYRHIEWALSDEQCRLLFEAPCRYCGALPMNIVQRKFATPYIYSGIDRVDNTRGYLPDNVTSCCADCNRSKGEHTVQEFLAWAQRVVRTCCP